MTILDWAVLVAYFVGITAFGLWMSRKIRSSGGYFLGDRKLPWWVMIGQSFGTGTHAENPVAQAGATFHFGFATIWYQWKNMLITPFYWLMAPWYRRCERTTIGEMIEDRYGRGMALLYTVFAICFFVFNQGAMLKGAGKVISVATGGEVDLAQRRRGRHGRRLPPLQLLRRTDRLGLHRLRPGLPDHRPVVHADPGRADGRRRLQRACGQACRPDFFELYNEASGIDAFTIVMLTLNGLVGITAQPHILIDERHRHDRARRPRRARPTARWSSASARSAGP